MIPPPPTAEESRQAENPKKIASFPQNKLADRVLSETSGLSSANVLYTWKKTVVARAGVAAESLDARVRQLEDELRRVERERDILKKALAIFGRSD